MYSPTSIFFRLYHLRFYGSFIDMGNDYLSYWPLVINFTPTLLTRGKAVELVISYNPLITPWHFWHPAPILKLCRGCSHLDNIKTPTANLESPMVLEAMHQELEIKTKHVITPGIHILCDVWAPESPLPPHTYNPSC